MADRADRVRAQAVNRHTRREGDTVQRMGGVGVAGGAADGGVDGGGVVHDARLRAIRAEIVQKARLGMTGGTGFRHRPVLVPIGEGQRRVIGMRRVKPLLHKAGKRVLVILGQTLLRHGGGRGQHEAQSKQEDQKMAGGVAPCHASLL